MLISKSTGARVVRLALLMMAATATIAAEPVSFTSFDIPGATSYFVAGINDEGLVAGSWSAADGSEIGFIRAPDGRISTPIVHPDDNTRTTVLRAVNDEGVIAGFYGANVSNGFLLTEGKFRTVDFPGAVATALRGINNLGDLSGTYSVVDLNADEFGFIIPLPRARNQLQAARSFRHRHRGRRHQRPSTARRLLHGCNVDAGRVSASTQRSVRERHRSRGAQHTSLWHQRLWNCGRILRRQQHGTRILRPPWEPAQLRFAGSGRNICAGNKQRGTHSRALCHS